jgi:enoyl-CoA hydratase/carnithine racemase
MSTEPVRLELRSAAAIVTLSRPDRLNSLDSATVLALGRVGRDLAGASDVRAVIVTGEGDKAFCAGADLKERASMDAPSVRRSLQAYRTELSWLDTIAVPVVAALNGLALGGGLEMALLCDLRVAASHAVLALPETSIGIIPGAGGTQRLPRIVGEARAKEMILLARRLTAEEALAWGLVNRVTAPGMSVVDDALEWIRPILEGASIAQGAALEAIDAARHSSLDAGLARELEVYERCLVSEDRKEALRAFAEKRKPVFKGR